MRPELEPPPPELEELFAAERSRPGPAPEIVEQLLLAVQAASVAPAPGPAASASTAHAAAGTAAATAKTGALVVAAFLVGAGSSVALYRQVAPPAPPPIVIVHAVPVRPTAETVPPSPSPAAREQPPAPAQEARPARKPQPAPASPPPIVEQAATEPRPDLDAALGAERMLMEQANTSLVRRQPREALAALEQHLARFPQGQLAEERESLWIQALLAAGDRPAAAVRARTFKARYPSSIFLPAVEALIPDDSVTE